MKNANEVYKKAQSIKDEIINNLLEMQRKFFNEIIDSDEAINLILDKEYIIFEELEKYKEFCQEYEAELDKITKSYNLSESTISKIDDVAEKKIIDELREAGWGVVKKGIAIQKGIANLDLAAQYNNIE